MSIVGCYILHLYCDFGVKVEGDYEKHGGRWYYELNFPGEFTEHTEAACFKEARKAGWKIYPAQRKAKCPHCVNANSHTNDNDNRRGK